MALWFELSEIKDEFTLWGYGVTARALGGLRARRAATGHGRPLRLLL